MKALLTLIKMESKLALRDGNMLIFGIIFPLALTLLLGFIQGPEEFKQNFAGLSCIGICASGLMGIPLTLSGYRHEKILKKYRVSPVQPGTLLLAISLLQALIALVSGILVLLCSTLFFGLQLDGGLGRYFLSFLFVLVNIFSLGYLIASLSPNTKTSNLVCTIAYFPMLFLSGATIPFSVFPWAVQKFAQIFPLTQGIRILNTAVFKLGLMQDLVPLIILSLITLAAYGISLKTFRWE